MVKESIKGEKIHIVVPNEVPVYRYTHPYGSISIYSILDKLSPERVLLLLEQAKFDLLFKRPAQESKPSE